MRYVLQYLEFHTCDATAQSTFPMAPNPTVIAGLSYYELQFAKMPIEGCKIGRRDFDFVHTPTLPFITCFTIRISSSIALTDFRPLPCIFSFWYVATVTVSLD